MSHVEILSDYRRLPTEDISARYVAALMRDGVAFYVENASVSIRALRIDGRILPLAINAGTGDTSYVCSPSAQYLSYTAEEFAKRHSLPAALVRRLVSPFGAFLHQSSVDRVAFINNWLFSTNPSPELNFQSIQEVTDRVLEQCPDFAIVFRSINPRLDPSLCQSLLKSGYRFARSRRVYVLDGPSKRRQERNNAQTDLKLLEKSAYRLVRCHRVLEQSASRIADLYQALYLSKHSRLNPHFNREFFLLALRENILTFVALEKDGRIDGFVTYFVEGDRMTGAVLGYDLDLARKVGLYRMLVAILISEATERGLRLNLSAGVGRFKMLRGALPVEEFDAIYDRHLPALRRLAWSALRMGGWLGSRSKPPLWPPERRPGGLRTRGEPLSTA